MKHLGSWENWMLFDLSETTGEMLRVAYNREDTSWYHVCDSETGAWDPDPQIPQPVIDMHFHAITQKASLS